MLVSLLRQVSLAKQLPVQRLPFEPVSASGCQTLLRVDLGMDKGNRSIFHPLGDVVRSILARMVSVRKASDEWNDSLDLTSYHVEVLEVCRPKYPRAFLLSANSLSSTHACAFRLCSWRTTAMRRQSSTGSVSWSGTDQCGTA